MRRRAALSDRPFRLAWLSGVAPLRGAKGHEKPRASLNGPPSASSSQGVLVAAGKSSLRLRKLRRLVCACPDAARVRGLLATPAGAGPTPTSRRNRFMALRGIGRGGI